MSMTFPVTTTSSPTTAERRAEIFSDPGFCNYFSDHMSAATWTVEQGWHEDGVVPYAPFTMDPASAVLHYAQEIFEGMKAYRHEDGSIWLFRPEKNAQRFQRSARRLAMPEMDEADFVASVEAIVRADADWVPSGADQSMYLRPFMIADEAFLGVRAAQRYSYRCIASPVGSYFAGGVTPVGIWVTPNYTRAAPGGTGAAKCGGNYAASLIAQNEAYTKGCQQVLFADAREHAYLEELGGMNVFLITKDGRLITPALTGTILEGVTRDSILALGSELGLSVEERAISVAEVFDGIKSHDISEVFACGTAAAVSPIGFFKTEQETVTAGEQPGEVTMKIREQLLGIQYGRVEDKWGWTRQVSL